MGLPLEGVEKSVCEWGGDKKRFWIYIYILMNSGDVESQSSFLWKTVLWEGLAHQYCLGVWAMKQRGQWGQTQVGPWEPMMVDAQALGGCEPVVCAEDQHCGGAGGSSEKPLGWELALSCYLSLHLPPPPDPECTCCHPGVPFLVHLLLLTMWQPGRKLAGAHPDHPVPPPMMGTVTHTHAMTLFLSARVVRG